MVALPQPLINGSVAEWPKATVCKTVFIASSNLVRPSIGVSVGCVGESPKLLAKANVRVRIPLPLLMDVNYLFDYLDDIDDLPPVRWQDEDRYSSPKHIHTFPVDPSLTPDEAWKEICIMGIRTTYTGAAKWANIQCDGDECSCIQES